MERRPSRRISVLLRSTGILLLGLAVFSALNILMLQMNYDLWTNPKVGYWSAFHKGFCLSGFDQHTYIMISKWRPLYELYRHPLLSMMVMPLSEFNDWLSHLAGFNCAILIVAVLWTLMSTTAWWLLYKLLHYRLRIRIGDSLLLCLLFFSFSHVMLATFAPDHMIISLLLLLLTLWLASAPRKRLSLWLSLPMFFISAGVTLTNGVKVWIIDMLSNHSGKSGKHIVFTILRRSLAYLLPLSILAGCYLWQVENTEREEHAFAQRMDNKKASRDSIFAQQQQRDSIRGAHLEARQLSESHFFQYTDNSVPRWPLLVESIFGEGIILHEDYLLQDVNNKQHPRPVIVHYRHIWPYIVEFVIVALFLFGAWSGRRIRLLRMAFAIFLFDMLLHLGLRFAATEPFIMTAHWAFVIPIAIGCLIKRLRQQHMKKAYFCVTTIIIFLTILLWWHNGSNVFQFIVHSS